MDIEAALKVHETPHLSADTYRAALETMIKEYMILTAMLLNGDKHLLPTLLKEDKSDVRNRIKWAERMEGILRNGKRQL